MQGCTVFCIASGPSLTESDCDAVRATGAPVIAINTTWERCRNAAVIFAADAIWWRNNADKVDIDAERVSLSQNAEKLYGAKKFTLRRQTTRSYNSGCAAIEYALWRGAARVALLGYDCSIKNGLHWLGRHLDSSNPDKQKCRNWQKHFAALRDRHPDADIVNCSRYTELKMFPRIPLGEVIGQI